MLSYSASGIKLLTLRSCGLFLLICFYITRMQKFSKYEIKQTLKWRKIVLTVRNQQKTGISFHQVNFTWLLRLIWETKYNLFYNKHENTRTTKTLIIVQIFSLGSESKPSSGITCTKYEIFLYESLSTNLIKYGRNFRFAPIYQRTLQGKTSLFMRVSQTINNTKNYYL